MVQVASSCALLPLKHQLSSALQDREMLTNSLTGFSADGVQLKYCIRMIMTSVSAHPDCIVGDSELR